MEQTDSIGTSPPADPGTGGAADQPLTTAPSRALALSLLRLARPTHWMKNVIVLLPLLFAQRLLHAESWIRAGVAFAAFCLASSAVYVFNDLRDARQDRLHPTKRRRPIASGQVSPRAAVLLGAVLTAGALAMGLSLSLPMAVFLLAYLALQGAYTLGLKHRMILDVICIALGFVLRAVGGAVAIRVEASPWLIICAFTLCLFMGFCKRRNEIVTLADPDNAHRVRPTLANYTPELLTHLITLSAGVAIVSYLLYATYPGTVEHFGTIYLVYTLPIVIYGVTRFAMLSMAGLHDGPVDIIVHDRVILLTAAAWLVAVGLIVYLGPEIQAWVARNH